MNDFTIKTPTIRVPGLLTDDAMQEQLKQFKQSGLNGGATPVPDGAVELADRVTNEFLDSPMRNLLKTAAAAAPTPISTPANAALSLTNPAKPDPQQQAIDLRSDIMADPNNSFGRFASFIVGPLVRPGGMVDNLGTLTPEESAKLQQERIEQGKEEIATVERHNKVRDQLRSMTDDQAAAMGFPVQPGMDDQTQKELQKQDEDRLQSVKDYVKLQTVEAPKKTWWLDAINSFDRSFSSSVTSMGKSAAIGLVELPGELTGVRNSGRSDLRAWFDTVDAAMEKMIPPDKARDQDFINLLSAGGGSMSTFLVGGLVGKTLGIPAKVSTLVLGAATQASQQYEDAEAHNGTELQRLISFFAGAGLGATEAIPINRMLGRAEQATGGMVSKMLRNTATSSLEEFTQELGQNIGTDVVAKWLYDEQRKMNWSGYLKQAAVGGILGAMGGTATTVMENSGIKAPRDNAEAQTEKKSEEDTAFQEQAEAQQHAFMEQIIADTQLQFDQLIGGEPASPLAAARGSQAETPLTQSADTLVSQNMQEARPRTQIADDFAAGLERPALFEPATQPAKGGTVPAANKGGTITLRHYSSQPLDVVDPAKQGTGPLIGQERARLFGPDAVQRSYYGVNSGPDYVAPSTNVEAYSQLSPDERVAAKRLEKAFVRAADVRQALGARYQKEAQAGGYRNEGLGDFVHEVEVLPDDLYNAAEDPLKLRDGIEATDNTGRITEYERRIKDAGFRGVYFPKSSLGATAMLFDAAQPTRVTRESTGEVVSDNTAKRAVEGVQLKPEDLQPLPGAAGRPVERVVRAARAYAASAGLPFRRQKEYVKVDVDRATRIAQAYEDMKDDPADPKVQAAFQAMVDETLAQFQFVKASGLAIDFIEPGQTDPYPSGPKEVLDDLQRGHLWVFPTDQGFGTVNEADAQNPLLQPTGEVINGRQLVANDVFRIVHDFFGHGIEGSGFGARGEENAWQSHMRLYSDKALPAVTSETRGQNSWVNYGPYGESNRKNQRETVYADQKTGLMPDWTWKEGVGADEVSTSSIVTGSKAFMLDGEGPATIAAIYKNAKQWQAQLAEAGEALAEETGAEFKNPGIKKRATSEEKLQRKSYPNGARELTDVVRGGFIVDNPAQADRIFEELATRFNAFDEGWSMQAESGYFDRKVLVKFEDGTVGEVQIWPRELLKAKSESGHKLYVESRSPSTDDKRRAQLLKEQKKVYADALAVSPDFASIVGSGQASGNSPLKSASDNSVASSAASSRAAGESGAQVLPSSLENTPARMLSSVTQGLPSQAQSRLPSTGEGTDLPAGTFTGNSSSGGDASNVGAGADVVNTGNADLFASTSSTRGTYKAEPKRAAGGVAGQTNASADNVSLRQISDNFKKLLDLTVRQGRFTIKGADVMGQFSAKSGVVRLRTANDLSSLIHEGGHALEVNADGELKTFVANNRVMLQTIARKLYGGDVSNLPDKAKTSEGFAEFFRVYVTNKRFAEINYPTITADFDALLDRTNPQLRDGLKLIGDQYAAWLQMPSSQLLRNMIQSGKQTDGINTAIKEMREEGLVNWFREVVNGVHSATINRFDTLNQLVAGILNTSEARNNKVIDLKRADDPRALIRLAANSGQRAMVQLTDGVMGHRSTGPFTPGLRAALVRYHGKAPDAQLSAIDANRQRDFAAYLVALRGIDEYNRFSQGIIERPPVAATLGDLTTVVSEMEKQYGDDFKDAAQMVHQYAMGLWEKSHDAGLIDDQTYEDGKNRTFYVPLQRDMSDKQMTQSGISASQARQGRSIVKRFRGSDRDIIDPVDALMQKTFALEKVIAENEVKVALAKLADKAGTVGSLVERVPANKLLGQQYSIQEVARQLTKDPTMSPTDAADLMSLLEAAIDDGNRIALFRSQQAMAAGENIVFFWENGKLSALQLQDGDVGTDVLNTLNAVGTETVPFLVDLIAYPSTVFRAAVTSWPDFLLVNFVRDQMSAFVLTEGYTPFVSGLRGVGDELRQHGWAREYNAAMGTMGGMNSSTLHDARVKTDINALRKRGYIAKAFRSDGGGYAGAIKGLARVTELTETGTRLGIFRSAYDRAIKDGLTPWEASVEASYISTDYIDFSLHGNRMLAWRRLVPFLNAQLQGLNKMVRTLAGDEVRQRRGLMFAVSAFFKDVNNLPLSRTEKAAIRTGRKAWLKMASLGIIGAALQAAFQDDPDYQDASEYLRTTGWVIPIGNGQIFYIPKPFELAMVSNFVERGFEIGSGDTEAKNRLLRGMAMNLLPPTNPPAIQSVVEQLANWDSFSGREIVPDYMRALEPELQYNHFTTGFAKSLGSMLGWSPMRIDHFMSGIGASAYRDLTQMYDTSDPNRPSSDVSDWPITRRFVRDARRGAVSAQDFWKFASTVTGSLRRAEVTYKSYIDSGKEAAAENFLSELSPDERAYAVLNTHFKAEYKRLNPMYRVAQENGLISAMRRELYSDQGVENTMKGNEDAPIMLSAKEKADVDNVLSELSRREMRNALIFMKAPGWANKRPLPTEPTIELLRATSPDTADEFERRIKKAKVYTAETVQDYWPEVRDRLIQDGDGAFLKDILAVAKAMR